MSKFRDGHVSQKGFVSLPKVGDAVPAISQPKGSLDFMSVSSHASSTSRHRSMLPEGDLITGTISVSHERAHMLSAIQDSNHTAEKEDLVCTFLPLLMAQHNPSGCSIRRIIYAT